MRIQVVLKQSMDQYISTEKAVQVTLSDIDEFVGARNKDMESLLLQYQNENITLEQVANAVKFTNIITTVQGHEVTNG